MSRFLLLPCNNTLSHIAKCLALGEALEERGHEAILAVSKERAAFLERIGNPRHYFLPDIQETNGGALPGFVWFRPECFKAVVRAELELLERLKPDAVLGVFRFTGQISARLAGVPYDSLTCGSMTPVCEEALGFEPDEAGAKEQEAVLHFFRRACARRLAPALDVLGVEPVQDIWQLLQGSRTFLWDFPEFQPLQPFTGYHHIGPLNWSGWPCPKDAVPLLESLRKPIAYVAFGTGGISKLMIQRLIEALWSLGYSVALAMGGQSRVDLATIPGRLIVFDFLPLDSVSKYVSLVVCHGGQLLVFEAMRSRLPVFVIPLQPEQAQNGRCVERMGCGQRLVRGVVYDNLRSDIEAAFLKRSTVELAEQIERFLADKGTPSHLEKASQIVNRQLGSQALVSFMESAE